MRTFPLNDGAFAALEGIQDPPLEALFTDDVTTQRLTSVFSDVRTNHGLYGLASKIADKFPDVVALAPTTVTPDPMMLREAQRLFGRYSTEISGALLLAALPQSYATDRGARVLRETAGLEEDLTHRVKSTALFLMIVMQRTPLARAEYRDFETLRLWNAHDTDPCDQTPAADHRPHQVLPWHMCAALRLYHHAIRHHLRDKPELGTVLNQQDLIGMLLTFTISVFEVLERYGICWTADEQTCYLHAWDVIGAHLGIGSPEVKNTIAQHDAIVGGWCGLRPDTLPESRALLDQIRKANWVDPGPNSASNQGVRSGMRSGRVLTSALLDELTSTMPSPLKLLPITVMRALAPGLVADRLSLGRNGLIVRALAQLPRRRRIVDRFTEIRAPNVLGGRVLRTMANEVTSRASVRFLDNAEHLFPGLENWNRGVSDHR